MYAFRRVRKLLTLRLHKHAFNYTTPSFPHPSSSLASSELFFLSRFCSNMRCALNLKCSWINWMQYWNKKKLLEHSQAHIHASMHRDASTSLASVDRTTEMKKRLNKKLSRCLLFAVNTTCVDIQVVCALIKFMEYQFFSNSSYQQQRFLHSIRNVFHSFTTQYISWRNLFVVLTSDKSTSSHPTISTIVKCTPNTQTRNLAPTNS